MCVALKENPFSAINYSKNKFNIVNCNLIAICCFLIECGLVSTQHQSRCGTLAFRRSRQEELVYTIRLPNLLVMHTNELLEVLNVVDIAYQLEGQSSLTYS